MSRNIVIKKTKKKNFIIVQEKHKIVDVLGFFNEKNQIQDLNKEKLKFYIKNGATVSNTILSKIKHFQLGE